MERVGLREAYSETWHSGTSHAHDHPCSCASLYPDSTDTDTSCQPVSACCCLFSFFFRYVEPSKRSPSPVLSQCIPYLDFRNGFLVASTPSNFYLPRHTKNRLRVVNSWCKRPISCTKFVLYYSEVEIRQSNLKSAV